MPAPIDWANAGGLDSVKQLTIELGPREAARRLGLSPAHADALRQICARQGWLASVPRANVTTRVTGPVTITGKPVTSVTTASEAAQNANAEHSARGRAALLRYGAKTAEHAAELPPAEALASAPMVASVAKTLALAGDWPAGSAPGVSVNILFQ